MNPRIDPPRALLELADLQAGVLTGEQAHGHGLSRNSVNRIVRCGQWKRLGPGVLFAGRPPVPWLALAWGGVLLGPAGSRLGGSAAGYLHGLIEDPPDTITVKVPWGRPVTDRWPWRFEQERAGVRRSARADPPHVGVADTVLDLCQDAAEAEVTGLVTAAVQSRKVTVAALRRCASERARLRHRALIRNLLGDVEKGAETPLELQYLRRVERPHGLPESRRQTANRAGGAQDVRYDEYLTIVELDGRIGHTGAGRFRDMGRDNLSTLSGAATLRYGHADLFGTPCRVAWQVAQVLMSRGWVGIPRRCQQCVQVPDNGWI